MNVRQARALVRLLETANPVPVSYPEPGETHEARASLQPHDSVGPSGEADYEARLACYTATLARFPTLIYLAAEGHVYYWNGETNEPVRVHRFEWRPDTGRRRHYWAFCALDENGVVLSPYMHQEEAP